MIDTEKLNDLKNSLRDYPEAFWNYEEQFSKPFIEAIGNDRKGLEAFLSDLDGKDLYIISSVFQDIYEVWTDNKMWNFLDGLSKKIKDAGLNP